MYRLCITLSALVLASLLTGCASSAKSLADNRTPTSLPEKTEPTGAPETVSQRPPTDCPISVSPNREFVSPPIPFISPPASFPNEFWFGSNHLWTSLRADGTWSSLPHNLEGYTQKIFWWSDLFSLKDEPEPELIVTGQRLDAKASPLNVSRATNAYGEDIGEAMLTGVEFPTLGCWKITGLYKESELSFVVWVAP
jgi:hypothetical protein